MIFALFPVEGEAAKKPLFQSWWPRKLVLLGVANNYEDALVKSRKFKEQLGVELNLRKLIAHPKTGLTLEYADCISQFGKFPCYPPRGKDFDTAYVSIEHSLSFKGIPRNKYLIVLGAFPPESPSLKAIFATTKSRIPEGQILDVQVFLGWIGAEEDEFGDL